MAIFDSRSWSTSPSLLMVKILSNCAIYALLPGKGEVDSCFCLQICARIELIRSAVEMIELPIIRWANNRSATLCIKNSLHSQHKFT